MKLQNKIKSWPFRLLLIYFCLSTYWLTHDLSHLYIHGFTTIYLKVWCYLSIILAAFMASGSDSILSPDNYNGVHNDHEDDEGDVQVNYANISTAIATKVSFLLSLLFPLVVMSHWLYCSKLTWSHHLILLIYTVVCLTMFLTSFTSFSNYFDWTHVMSFVSLFHIYPSFLAGNYLGLVAALLFIVSQIFAVETQTTRLPPYSHMLACLFSSLAASALLVQSFYPMIPPQPTSDWQAADWGWYLASFTGATKYVGGGKEYKCFQVYDFHGVKVRKA